MKVVDLFCGCGGLSMGFQKAGMEVVAAFDNWPEALSVYRRNFAHPAICANLMDVERAACSIRQFAPDMIIGGPPCQDFSPAGKRNEDNGRGGLTVCYAKIISEVRPKWFVMENVERILKSQKLQEALAIFAAAGYGVTYTVLNAALCGVPQKRKRFVMIGKLDAENDFMKKELMEKLSDHEMSVAEYFGEKLDIKYYYRHPRSYVRRGIFSISEPSATIRGVNRPMPKGYTLHPGDPVDSLEGIRALTSHERSMIQTFPEDFCFEGTKTNIEQMIGNAVPVNLGYYIADAILRYSGENRLKNTPNVQNPKIMQLSLFDLLEHLKDHVIEEKNIVSEEDAEYNTHEQNNDSWLSKKCIIGVVNKNSFALYDNHAAVKYNADGNASFKESTGAEYFVPYFEGVGIRDLYVLKNVNVNNVTQDKKCIDTAHNSQICFEIEFEKQLFEDYHPLDMTKSGIGKNP